MVVYDKGKYHDESVAEASLPEEHADHHIVYFLRWLIERDLVSDELTTGAAGEALARYRAGEQDVFWLFEWWDRWLTSDMLSPAGNAFAQAYFDYDRGQYLADYEEVLVGALPSVFHVEYTEDNYRRLAARIDERWRAFAG